MVAIFAVVCWAVATPAAAASPQLIASLEPDSVPPLRACEYGPDTLKAMQISRILQADSLFQRSHYAMTVAVAGGKVLLRGIVYSELQRARAESLAETATGISQVVNNLHTMAPDN
jgi:osmotically-inducible protein OsmY